MSEESNSVIPSTEKDGNPENRPMEDNPRSALHSDKSPSIESADIRAEREHIQEYRQPIELALPERKNGSIHPESLENNVETAESSPSEQKQTTSDAPTETKSLERTNDIDQPAMKSTASTEIALSMAPSSDKALEEVTENIQSIHEKLKDMKLSEEIAAPASGKKGRKLASTPRARSTPVKLLSSPPLTRSRSRDLQKFSSTPSSPGRLSGRKGSESDSEEIKGIRGRKEVKKN